VFIAFNPSHATSLSTSGITMTMLNHNIQPAENIYPASDVPTDASTSTRIARRFKPRNFLMKTESAELRFENNYTIICKQLLIFL
jgi:hypothetical protein